MSKANRITTLSTPKQEKADPADRTGLDARRLSELLQGIADATHLLISQDVREREILASIEILRQAACADRVCLEVTAGDPLNAGTALLRRCVGVDRWTSSFDPPMRWRRLLSANMPVHETVQDLPAGEQVVLSRDGVRSVLSIPVMADKMPRGHIRFDRMVTAEGWTKDEIFALQTAANVYGGALAHVEVLAALRKSEARYRRLVENAPDFIYRMSLPDGRYEYVSPAAEEVFGYDRQEILDHPVLIRDALHPGWRGYFETEWDKLLRGEAPPTYEYAILHGGTGETRWLHQRNVLLRDDEGNTIAIEGIVSDITQRKRAELRLRTQQSMLESIFRAAPVGIGVVSDRVFLQVNEGICKMTGYSREELIGASIRKLYPTEADYAYVGKVGYGSLFETGIASVESRWQRKDGAILDVHLSGTPLDPQDLAAGVTLIVMDITARKRAEAEMQRSLLEKESLLLEIHHRVINNLAVVSDILGLQALQLSDPLLVASLQESRGRVHAMARVHEHLCRVPDLGRVAMGPYIELLSEELQETLGTNVAVTINADDVHLGINQATPCALILNELISNSLRHAFPPDVPRDEPAQVTVELAAEDSSCRLVVADNGVGLTAGASTSHARSLGLRLVELLCSQLSGDLRQTTDNGTRVEVTFPLSSPGSEPAGAERLLD